MTLRLCLVILISCVAGIGGAGCKRTVEKAGTEAPSAPQKSITWPAKRKTDGGNFTVTLQPDTKQIVRGTHFALEAVVEPAAGASAPTVVVIDADMPSHGHGMNTKPEIVQEGGQKYRAKGMLFHMDGEWVITVEVSAGDKKERAFFPVTLE